MAFQDWPQVYRDQSALFDHESPVDHTIIDVRGCAKDQRRNGVVQPTGEANLVQDDGDEIRRHARREDANIVPAKHRRAAPRGDFQRFAGRHRAGVALHPLEQHRLARFSQQMAAVVRRGAVHAQANAHALAPHLPHRRDPGCQPHVG